MPGGRCWLSAETSAGAVIAAPLADCGQSMVAEGQARAALLPMTQFQRETLPLLSQAHPDSRGGNVDPPVWLRGAHGAARSVQPGGHFG